MGTEFKEYRLRVNGRDVTVRGWDKRSLMDVLRDDLRLTGTKNGCSQGYCGSCRVILDGVPLNSCTTTLRVADGGEVTTIEGLGTPEHPHSLQHCMATYGASQCGFCTPGFIVSAAALLQVNPKPSREEIKRALEENICRCTGYQQIFEAVERAAGVASAPIPESEEKENILGCSPLRKDALAKCCGVAIYGDDIYVDGMLHGAVYRSPYPHARILSIDTSEAKALPGVHAILTAKDVPHNRYGLIVRDQPVLAEGKVRYVGEPVFAVAAETEALAEAAFRKVKIEWGVLPPLTDPRKALQEDAPFVQDLEPEGQIIKNWGKNIVSRRPIERGDVEEAFAEADLVLSGDFTTQFQEHAYLEPESCVCYLERNEAGEDVMVVHCAGQNVFSDRDQVAEMLKWPKERVRCILPACGGAFGGKEDVVPQCIAALLAWRTRRPVKYVLSREESLIASTKRHPFLCHVELAARRDGRLLAVRARHIGDTGAYASVGDIVMTRAATHAGGPYAIDHVSIDVVGVFTNNPIGGAMRGFGTPQAIFPMEVMMDRLAAELGIDPVELRRINALEAGKRTPAGQLLTHSVGLKECLERAAEAAGWEAFRRAKRDEGDGKIRRGMGVALAYKNVGLGNDSEEDKAAAEIELKSDGRLLLRTGACEIGQGMTTILCQLAAEELNVPYEKVDILAGDTALTPDSGVSSASRQTFMTGNAVLLAAKGLREKVLSTAAEDLDIPPDLLEMKDGWVQVKGRPQRRVSLSELARRPGRRLLGSSRYHAPKTHKWGENQREGYKTHVTYGFGAQVAQVAVNMETGWVKVEKLVAAHDVGRALHPAACRGQVEGGIVQGVGYALTEEFLVKEGKPKSKLFKRCGLPTTWDIPEMTTILVEDREAQGPRGAKGVGEISIIPTAPAIINAIYDAVGVWITDLPATPDKVLAALRAKEGGLTEA